MTVDESADESTLWLTDADWWVDSDPVLLAAAAAAAGEVLLLLLLVLIARYSRDSMLIQWPWSRVKLIMDVRNLKGEGNLLDIITS